MTSTSAARRIISWAKAWEPRPPSQPRRFGWNVWRNRCETWWFHTNSDVWKKTGRLNSSAEKDRWIDGSKMNWRKIDGWNLKQYLFCIKYGVTCEVALEPILSNDMVIWGGSDGSTLRLRPKSWLFANKIAGFSNKNGDISSQSLGFHQ